MDWLLEGEVSILRPKTKDVLYLFALQHRQFIAFEDTTPFDHTEEQRQSKSWGQDYIIYTRDPQAETMRHEHFRTKDEVEYEQYKDQMRRYLDYLIGRNMRLAALPQDKKERMRELLHELMALLESE